VHPTGLWNAQGQKIGKTNNIGGESHQPVASY